MMTEAREHREFIRHPLEIPIHVWHIRDTMSAFTEDAKQSRNVSFGGLAFSCETPWEIGSLLHLRVPLAPPFDATGRVAWCRRNNDVYEVGVEFVDSEEAFKAQMIEQVCYIEVYRQQLAANGRELSSEEAAMEWIEQYAADFRAQCSGCPKEKKTARVVYH